MNPSLFGKYEDEGEPPITRISADTYGRGELTHPRVSAISAVNSFWFWPKAGLRNPCDCHAIRGNHIDRLLASLNQWTQLMGLGPQVHAWRDRQSPQSLTNRRGRRGRSDRRHSRNRRDSARIGRQGLERPHGSFAFDRFIILQPVEHGWCVLSRDENVRPAHFEGPPREFASIRSFFSHAVGRALGDVRRRVLLSKSGGQ